MKREEIDMKKKLLMTILCVSMVLGCTACGNKEEKVQGGSATQEGTSLEGKQDTEKESMESDKDVAPVSAFTYDVDEEGNAVIRSYTATDEYKKIIIPEEIDGHKVVSIGNIEFEQPVFHHSDELLEEVVIPDTVQSIASMAFYGIKNLKKVDFGNGLTEIWAQAFMDTGLEEIELPESLTTIGEGAFRSTKLKKVELPKSLTYLGHNVFGGCKYLVDVKIASTTVEFGKGVFVATADDITITAPAGSTAEAYANEYELSFVAQ